MTTPTRKDGAIPVKDSNNQYFAGTLPGPGKDAPPADTPSVAVTPAAEPMSTGKSGTDEPPLVVHIPNKSGRGGARYYVKNPADKDRAIALGPDEAVEQGVAFPSITTCLGSLDKPALVPWAAGLTADAAEEKLRELQNMAPLDMAAAIDDMLEPKKGDRNKRSVFNADLRAAHREKKDSAAARGTEVHALCEALEHGTIDVDDVPEEYLGYVEGYQAFRDEYPQMKFLATEVTVAGSTDSNGGYMGTTDAIVELDGKHYVLDLKTNEKPKPVVYSSVGMQLAAAANADEIVFADGTTQPMPKIDGGLAVSLNNEGVYGVFLFETDNGGANHEGFENSVGAWHWKRRTSKAPKALKPGELSA